MEVDHIALFTLHGNGHVYPVLPLSAELVRRGYRVTWATIEPYAEMIRESGATALVVPRGSRDVELVGQATEADGPKDSDGPVVANYNARLIRATREELAHLSPLYDADTPQVILYDKYTATGRILAKRYAIPAVQMSAHFARCPNTLIRIDGVCQSPPERVAISAEFDKFLNEHGIEGTRSSWHTEDLNLHLIPRDFQYHVESFGDRFSFTGPLTGRPFRRSWKHTSGKKPLILISDFSGTADYRVNSEKLFRVLIDGLRDMSCRCILSVGEDTPLNSLGNLPKNFEITKGISHLEILPHVDLSINHGGMGSTLEAIYHAVPSLGIPLTLATREVSHRLTELDLGGQLSRDTADSVSVRAMVDWLLTDKEIRRNVTQMSERFRESGKPRLTADRLEEHFLTI